MVSPQLETTAVAGRLAEEVEEEISRAWQRLKLQSDFDIPPQLRIPHLSFQLLSGPFSRANLAALEDLAARRSPVEIQLSGLGLFSEPRSVLYITVVRSRHLENLHRDITLTLAEQGFSPHPLYRPEAWVPHISLAFDGLNSEDWRSLTRLEQKGAFHRRCLLRSIIVLSMEKGYPLITEVPLGSPREEQSDFP